MTLRSVLSTSTRARRAGPRRWAAGLAATLTLTACATTGGGEGGGSAPADDEQTLTIATSFAIDDLDPLVNGFWGVEFGYVELLMRPERNGSTSPWLLEELTAIDGTTWSLVLHDDVTFENGRDLDAQALARLLSWTAEQKSDFARASAFVAADVVDERTVTLSTSRPVPTLPHVLADESMVPVFDVEAYEEHLASGSAASALVDAGLYTGPYVVGSLDDQSAELAPFDDYWDGTPALDALTLRFVPEETSRVQAVRTGEADIALYMPTSMARTLRDSQDAIYVRGEGTGSTFMFVLNNAAPIYGEAAVRRAVYAAVDYRALAEDVLAGEAGVATGIFPPDLPYAVDTQVTDIGLAAGLLDDAGWLLEDGGVRVKDGQPLTMRLFSYPQQPDSTRIAEALQSQLGAVGFDVQVNQVDDMTAVQEGLDWDGAIEAGSLLSFGRSPVEGLSNRLGTGSPKNYARVADPDLDAAIAELGIEFDEARRTELLVRIQELIQERGHYAATVVRRSGVVTSPTWQDYELPVSNLWVDADTAPGA